MGDSESQPGDYGGPDSLERRRAPVADLAVHNSEERKERSLVRGNRIEIAHSLSA